MINREGPFDVTAVFLDTDEEARVTIRVEADCKYAVGRLIGGIRDVHDWVFTGPWTGWVEGRCWCSACGGPPRADPTAPGA
jgi:hypothetical protein